MAVSGPGKGSAITGHLLDTSSGRLSRNSVNRVIPGRREPSIPPGAAAVLHLQRTAGNQAVQRLLSAAQKGENLKSTRYSGNLRLEAAFDNSPAVGAGERGDAVALIQ